MHLSTVCQPPQSAYKITPSMNRLTNNINYHVRKAMQLEFNQQSSGDPLGYHQVSSYKYWNMVPHPGHKGSSNANNDLLKRMVDIMEN